MTSPEAGEVVRPDEVGNLPPGSEPSQAPAGEPAKARGNPIVNWLLVRKELAQAEANAAQFTSEQREFLRRAKLALELGELAFAPGNAVHSGSTAPLAANLFRQAVYWALLVHRPKAELVSPEQLWAETDRSALQEVAGNESEYAYLSIAMRSTFIELADGTDEAQRASAVQLRRTAKRLVANAQRVLWRLEWVKLKRIVRVVLAVLVPVAAIIGLWPTRPDLGKGAPWRVSSIGVECHPEKSDCGGVKTDILFHTRLEQEPWFEYDFGAPVSFSSLSIQNRTDYGPERAVPLVVEVSNDDKSFKEVARRIDSFTTWKPSFTPQSARYLRLRVARESILHLESVKVHP
ncbi:MAG: discoidin domain-containing protein [Pseudomonadota bacterium]